MKKITFQLTLSQADKEIKEKVEFNSKTTRYPMLYKVFFFFFRSFGWNQMLYNPVLVADRWDPKKLLKINWPKDFLHPFFRLYINNGKSTRRILKSQSKLFFY